MTLVKEAITCYNNFLARPITSFDDFTKNSHNKSSSARVVRMSHFPTYWTKVGWDEIILHEEMQQGKTVARLMWL